VAAIDLHLALRNSLLILTELARMLDHLRAAEALAEALDDRLRLGWVKCYLSNYYWWRGAAHDAVEHGQGAQAIGQQLGAVVLEVEANYYLGNAYVRLGDFRRATDSFGRNVALLEGDRVYERLGQARLPAAASLSGMGLVLAECGEFAVAAARVKEAVRIADVAKDPFMQASSRSVLCGLYCLKGDLQEAIRFGSEMLEHWEREESPFFTIDTGGEVSYAAATCVMRTVNGEQRAFARGVPASHSPTRTKLSAAAVATWSRCVLGSPT